MVRKIRHGAGMERKISCIGFSVESEEENYLSNFNGDDKVTSKLIWKRISNAFPRFVWLSVGRNGGLTCKQK
jgi:hypothetical protein